MKNYKYTNFLVLTIMALLLFSITPHCYSQALSTSYLQQGQDDKKKENLQSKEEETPASRQKKLIEKMDTVKKRLDSLQSELNELRLRVLQNRPRNPLVFGDPYYVDPKLREQISKVRRQLLETQIEFENLVNEIEIW